MDLKVNDSCQVSGGKYDEVKVNGSLSIDGDLEVYSLKVNGHYCQEGDLKVQEELKINGSADFKGQVTANEVKINGKVKLMNTASLVELKINGQLISENNITTEWIKNNGELTVDGDVESESFYSNGKFSIEGLLNSDIVEITPNRKSQVREIGGRYIRIGFKNSNSLLDKIQGQVKTSVIEGDLIDLASTSSEVVRGDKITVRNNCTIDRVEYKTALKIIGNGKVNNSIKIGE